MTNFVNLHQHSEYSLLDGTTRIRDLVTRTKELGMNAVALTDHGNMYGIIEFYKTCLEEGIKPVIGAEVYVTNGSRFDKTPKNREYYHLILLAENNKGYENLMKIVSIGNVDGYYYRPRVDYETLEKYSSGLISTSACISGEVQRKILNRDYEGAREAALRLESIFGKGNFFLELQDHGMEEQKIVNEGVLKLSKETGIELVCTNDSHYTNKDDFISHDVLLCVQTGKTVNEEKRMKFPSNEFYLKSPEEMLELFSYAPEALENTQKIADRCNVEIEFHNTKLPHFDIPDGYTNESYLRELIENGLREKYGEISPKINERYEYEFQTISQMGYVDYFLIVWDFVRFAKEHDIPVGPGRGSAAGSIISYALSITDIDPLKHDLLFERFLNPERISMPDIDIDFCYERRDEVIDYVNEKYGAEKVAQIVTFGKMLAKGAIRDVGRALDIPYGKVDSIAKMVPDALGMNLERALQISPELKRAYEEDYEVKKIIDIALDVEGLSRHTSTHAAGVLITGSDVTDYVPLTRNGDIICTQYNMTELEELGLLKMDFLGLRTLTVIKDTVDLVRENQGIEIDLNNLDLENSEVLEMFTRGETLGIFQFESAGMRKFLKDLKPDVFEDLVAANSLFRPGPMDQIPKFIESKHDNSKISYIHKSLEEILKPTYGAIVYQEQVMRIVQDIAGYSLGRADLVRRAMSKKKMAEMERERKVFIYGEEDEDGNILIPGAIRNGVDEFSANKIYDLMIDFANYAFNKSHSVSYSVVAFQTAYLKHYYPSEYMAALISSVVSNTTQVVMYLDECKRLGIEVLRPDVNYSFEKFSVEDGKIRFGLLGLKGMGKGVINSIVEARKKGEFKNLKDFITRVSDIKENTLNKRAIEALIKSGSLDNIIPSRAKALAVFEDILSSHNAEAKRNVEGQFNLFTDYLKEDSTSYEINFPNIPEFPKKELYAMEKEITGIYLTGHPLGEYKDLITRINKHSISEIKYQDENLRYSFRDGERIILAGMIVNVNKVLTRKNDLMAHFTLEDLSDTIGVTIFPRQFSEYSRYLKEDSLIKLEGQLQLSDNDDPKILANKIEPIDEREFEKRIKEKKNKVLYLKLDSRSNLDLFNKIVSILQNFRGDSEVVFYFEKEKSNIKNDYLKFDEDRIDELKYALYGMLEKSDIILK